jgi:hypothetical protein
LGTEGEFDLDRFVEVGGDCESLRSSLLLFALLVLSDVAVAVAFDLPDEAVDLWWWW